MSFIGIFTTFLIPYTFLAVQFSFGGNSQYTVNEGAGFIELQILKQGLSSETFSVIVETVDGTASSVGKFFAKIAMTYSLLPRHTPPRSVFGDK